jgi:hypothetical protein
MGVEEEEEGLGMGDVDESTGMLSSGAAAASLSSWTVCLAVDEGISVEALVSGS